MHDIFRLRNIIPFVTENTSPAFESTFVKHRIGKTRQLTISIIFAAPGWPCICPNATSCLNRLCSSKIICFSSHDILPDPVKRYVSSAAFRTNIFLSISPLSIIEKMYYDITLPTTYIKNYIRHIIYLYLIKIIYLNIVLFVIVFFGIQNKKRENYIKSIREEEGSFINVIVINVTYILIN